MLRTYSTNITGTADTAIVFNTNKIDTNRNVNHTAGSSDILINTPGYYKITVDANYSAAAAGLVSLQLFADNVALSDAISSITVTQNNVNNGNFTTIIKANPGVAQQNVILTVKPTADITINQIGVCINKLP